MPECRVTRRAPRVNMVTGLDPFNPGFLAGAFGIARPNLVPGVPLYLDVSGALGGKIINTAVFSIPTAGQRDGTQCTVGIRRDSVRFDAGKAVQTHRPVFFRREGISSTSSTAPILVTSHKKDEED